MRPGFLVCIRYDEIRPPTAWANLLNIKRSYTQISGFQSLSGSSTFTWYVWFNPIRYFPSLSNLL
jgi:hypothetical protein